MESKSAKPPWPTFGRWQRRAKADPSEFGRQSVETRRLPPTHRARVKPLARFAAMGFTSERRRAMHGEGIVQTTYCALPSAGGESRSGKKIRWPQGLAGSNPVPGTTQTLSTRRSSFELRLICLNADSRSKQSFTSPATSHLSVRSVLTLRPARSNNSICFALARISACCSSFPRSNSLICLVLAHAGSKNCESTVG